MSLLPTPAKPSDHRVLLVNDDGLHARGIVLLEELVREFTDDIWVVAPEEERSGAAHSLSITTPVRMRQVDERHYAVKGTPTDCVLLAYWELMAEQRPTMVISGINHGENLAEDLSYSGTAGGAMEAALLGLPAVAMSQVYTLGGKPRIDTATRFGPDLLKQLLTCEWHAGTWINVNFPNVAPDQVSGVRLTTQGQRRPGSFKPLRRVDGRNVPYWWIKIAYDVGEPAAGSDLEAIAAQAVSVTPLQMNMSDQDFRRRLAGAFPQ